MNIQVVTQQAWSFYLMKYAGKAEASGTINIQPEDLMEMGCEGFSDVQMTVQGQ